MPTSPARPHAAPPATASASKQQPTQPATEPRTPQRRSGSALGGTRLFADGSDACVLGTVTQEIICMRTHVSVDQQALFLFGSCFELVSQACS